MSFDVVNYDKVEASFQTLEEAEDYFQERVLGDGEDELDFSIVVEDKIYPYYKMEFQREHVNMLIEEGEYNSLLLHSWLDGIFGDMHYYELEGWERPYKTWKMIFCDRYTTIWKSCLDDLCMVEGFVDKTHFVACVPRSEIPMDLEKVPYFAPGKVN